MDKSEWQAQTGQTWAEEWRRTDRSFTLLTENLLATLRGLEAIQVLDIGCGAGELSLAIARGHPRCEVLGVDISPALVDVARERGENLPNVSFQLADAANWQGKPDFAPATLVSRHGVMFFDDPVGAFTRLGKIAAPGARLIFSCFRQPAANPFFTQVLDLLPEPLPPGDPDAPGPFAFADQARVARILRQAGWCDTAFDPLDFPMIAGAGPDPIGDAVAYFARIGPAARAAAAMGEADRERFHEDLRALAQKNCRDNIVSLPAAAWIVSARKA